MLVPLGENSGVKVILDGIIQQVESTVLNDCAYKMDIKTDKREINNIFKFLFNNENFYRLEMYPIS